MATKAIIMVMGNNAPATQKENHSKAVRLYRKADGRPNVILSQIADAIRMMAIRVETSEVFRLSNLKRICVDPMVVALQACAMDSTEVHLSIEESFYNVASTVSVEHLGAGEVDYVYVVDTLQRAVNVYAAESNSAADHLKAGLQDVEAFCMGMARSCCPPQEVDATRVAFRMLEASGWCVNASADLYGRLFMQPRAVVCPEASTFDF